MKNPPMALSELANRWRTEAELLARYGDDRGAHACRMHADELERAVREAEAEELTLAQAAAESGYSPDRLRHMVSGGVIPNAGEKGAPRIRRGDLPKKRARTPDSFDAHDVARRIMETR